MKILVVNDERMVCEWLKYCIQSSPGCELTGYAHNGGQASVLSKQTDVDAVFADTKMPVMRGLELLEKVKELTSKTVVVMLTAFTESDLVRETVRLGGDDCLIKMEMDDQTFRKALKRLEQRTSGSGSHSSVEAESTGRQHSVTSDILKGNRTLKEEDIRKLRDCHIRWWDDGLFATVVWKQELLQRSTSPENSVIHHMTGFEYDSRTYVMAENPVRNLSELKKIQLLHDYVVSIGVKNRCMVGVNTIADNLSHVTIVMEEAICGLSCSYCPGKVKAWEAPMRGGEIQKTYEQWGEYYRRQRRGPYELSGHAFYQKLEEVMDKSREEESILVSGLLASRCDAMGTAHMRFGHENAELVYRMMTNLETRTLQPTCSQEVREKILDFVRNILSYQDVDRSKLSRGVAAAMDYVRKHHSKAISLEQVSQEVHLNGECLSRIFKEEVGCICSTFFLEIGLKKTAYPLPYTSERVQEIAEQMGYPNVSYFSTTLKKRYRTNPYEYRRGE